MGEVKAETAGKDAVKLLDVLCIGGMMVAGGPSRLESAIGAPGLGDGADGNNDLCGRSPLMVIPMDEKDEDLREL
jgi:hypothetical protein